MLIYWRLVVITFFVLGFVLAPRTLALPDSQVVGRHGALSASSTLSASLPVHLAIPTIGVDAVFEVPLGLTAGGEVVVPSSYDQVGWYAYGPTPGEVGPAVVLGHVDSYRGPGVFWRLDDLTVGEQIFITRADGSVVQFEVVAVEVVSAKGFPAESVYGDTTTPVLRLLTCAGKYDYRTKRYSHTTIVYAELVSDTVRRLGGAI